MNFQVAQARWLRLCWWITLAVVATLVMSVGLWPATAQADWRTLTGILPAYDERNLSGLNGAGSIGDTQVTPDGKWIVYEVRIKGQDELRVSDGTEAQPADTPAPTPTVTPTPTLTPEATETSTVFEDHLPALMR